MWPLRWVSPIRVIWAAGLSAPASSPPPVISTPAQIFQTQAESLATMRFFRQEKRNAGQTMCDDT
jgi:hypothetical protein